MLAKDKDEDLPLRLGNEEMGGREEKELKEKLRRCIIFHNGSWSPVAFRK